MKPGLAVLPLEVWADIFLSDYKWISRQELSEFANKMKNRRFAEKLQKLLHDYGKQKLHYLQIASKLFSTRATLAVAHGYEYCESIRLGPAYKECEFPECELPENIKTFKQLSLRHLDDDVLNFLGMIKPLFTNVLLNIGLLQSTENVHLLLAHLLPMVNSIYGICCNNDFVQLFERHFPGRLAQAKELHLANANPATTHSYLNWLSEPQDFGVHGPRFLTMFAHSNIIITLVDAVRKHFLEATTSATFVMLIEYCSENYRAGELTIENGATNEQLSVRDAIFKCTSHFNIHCVQILRHPIGEETKMREWVEKRAYYEKNGNIQNDEAERVISVGGFGLPPLTTIGQITEEVDPVNQDNDQPAEEEDDGDKDATEPSKKKMNK